MVALVLGFSVKIDYLLIDQGNIVKERELQYESIISYPKMSSYWDLPFIHIDGNWSATASTYAWCSGDGSWGNPYTIENVTIDASGSPTGSGIIIENSKREYFLIRNCSVSNAGTDPFNAGIKLENTRNGTLVSNNCSNNGLDGILVYNFCQNNTILDNTANINTRFGLFIDWHSDYNILSGNTLNSNGMSGIRVRYSSDNNTISGNFISNSGGEGLVLHDNCGYNVFSGNIVINSSLDGIILLENCSYNTFSGNTVTSNRYGLHVIDYCHFNNISGNTISSNRRAGLIFDTACNNNTISRNSANNNGWWGMFLFDNCRYNTISGNNVSSNSLDGITLDGCDNSTVLRNFVSNNGESGVYLYGSRYNTLSRNTVIKNSLWGLNLDTLCNNNTISENYLYFNNNGSIVIQSVFPEIPCEYNIIERNVLVRNDWKFIDDRGANNTFRMNYYSNKFPSFIVEVLYQSFSTTDFVVTLKLLNEINFEVSDLSIQIWWEGTTISLNNIDDLGNGLYNITLTPIFVNSGEDPILLNMTISAPHHTDKYFEMYIAVEPPEIPIKWLKVEITDHFYSLEHFNLSLFVCDEIDLGIDVAIIQMWWNGTDVSTSVQNLGDGIYFISLDPITVAPGEDPILLKIVISASGYAEKNFETYIAVDPETLTKGEDTTPDELPPIVITIAIGSTIGALAVVGVLIMLLRRRK